MNQSSRPVTQLKRDFMEWCIKRVPDTGAPAPTTQAELTEMWKTFRDTVLAEEGHMLTKVEYDRVMAAPPPKLWPDGTVHNFHSK